MRICFCSVLYAIVTRPCLLVMTEHTGNVLVTGAQYSQTWSAIVLLSMIIFVASYASGLGNVPWQQGELFGLEGTLCFVPCSLFTHSLILIPPPSNVVASLLSTPLMQFHSFCRSPRFSSQVRGIGTSLATATNWSANLIINSTYLSLMTEITPSGAFGFYAGLCLLGFIFCVCYFPETAGLSLEEVRWVFENGFGIRRSRQLREAKRAMMAGVNARERKGA